MAAHRNHMDDMIGTVLDMADAVQVIIDWIVENGGWKENALYVTSDHDHYLTLLDNFPEALANLIIAGEPYNITPKNNSGVAAYEKAIQAGRHLDDSKTKTELIKEFTTWTEQDIENVGHFWGPRGSGGNGWSYHTTRPIPLYYMGDNGCIESLTGAGYRVLGREVQGQDDMIDHVHLHACLYRSLFGL